MDASAILAGIKQDIATFLREADQRTRTIMDQVISQTFGAIWSGGRWKGEGIWIDNSTITVDSHHRLVAAGSGSTGGWTRLAETILTASAATIDFTAIAGSYRHLVITAVLRTDSSTAVGSITQQVRLNGDTGANYDWVRQDLASTGPDGAQAFGDTSINLGYLINTLGPANTPTAYTITLYDYARTSWVKTLVTTGYFQYGTASEDIRALLTSGRWNATVAITRVTLLPSDGSNYIAGSVVTLWGVS